MIHNKIELLKLVESSAKNAEVVGSVSIKPNWRKDEWPLVAEIRYGSDSFNYKIMQHLAEDLQTDLIDIGAMSQEEGGCDTCSFTANYVILTVRWRK